MPVPINITQLLAWFNCGPVTGERPTLTLDTDTGQWSETSAAPVTLNPVAIYEIKTKGDELQRDTDVDRIQRRVKIAALQEVKHSDRLPWHGSTWRVITVHPYESVPPAWLAEAELVT